MAALLAREHSGKGQHIQCNLLASQIAGLLNIGSNYLNAGMVGRPLGTEHESRCFMNFVCRQSVSIAWSFNLQLPLTILGLTPYQAFQTRDGRFYVVGATNDKTFRDLCKSMDLNSLPDMPEFQTYANRMKNREKLIEIFSQRFKEENLKYWKRVLRSQSFPSGAVNNIKEAFEHEQVQHLNLIEAVNHPQYGTVKLTKPPVEFR